MSTLPYFLGRFHVLLLHLPIGILLLAVVLEVASRRERFRHLTSALDAVWMLGALSAIGTAILGYLHASEGGFDGAVINAHRIAGTSLAILATLVVIVRMKFVRLYAKTWIGSGVAVVALLFVTGHFGGILTHGDTYLTQYAPGSRARPKDLASADLYLDVVAPAFQQRCSACHNDGKRKGGLSLATYESLMKGGEHGPVVIARQPEKSDLIRRISLPHDDADFMPHDGKTPLTPDQTAAVRWWVGAGAPRKSAVLPLSPPPDVRANIEVALGLRAPAATTTAVAAVEALPDIALDNVPPADVQSLDELERRGFAVRAVAAASPFLQADYTASRPLTNDDIDALSRIARQLRVLNLRHAGVTDAHLKTLGTFDNLTHLRLERNPITDHGVAALTGLAKLEYLNLYGTRVTNASLASLTALPKLREVFVWQTSITPPAAAEFRRTHARVSVVQGFDAKTFPEGPKVIPVVN